MKLLGIELSKFPLEPTYGKALLSSYYLGCDDLMMILVSVLSSENLWVNVSRNRNSAESGSQDSKIYDVKKNFSSHLPDYKSDHMLLIEIYNEWRKHNNHHRESEWCYRNFI